MLHPNSELLNLIFTSQSMQISHYGSCSYCSSVKRVIRNVRDFHQMDSTLFHALLMDLLRFICLLRICRLFCLILFSITNDYSLNQVWDHISGKLKKDLQYQAEVSLFLFLSS